MIDEQLKARLKGVKLYLKVLTAQDAKPIKKLKRENQFKRYQLAVRGDCIQIDPRKIMPGIYQYTAIDNCSLWPISELYKRRTAAKKDVIVEQFSFSIQPIKSDENDKMLPFFTN